MTDKTITVYGAEWCGFCHMVKRYLDDKKIAYTYIDIDKDPAFATEAVNKSGQRGIPVTDIGGDIIVGFDKPKIDASLKLLQLA
jgi:glutaredoxin 3